MIQYDDGWTLALKAVERSRTQRRHAASSPDLWDRCADFIREHATPRMLLDALVGVAVLGVFWWIAGRLPQ